MNRRSFLHTAAASAATSCLSGFAIAESKAGGIHPPDDAFVATLPHLLDLATLPGLGVGVMRPGQPLWQHYEGVANMTTKAPITASSVFPGASLGKPVFACVVLKMAQEGAIDLDRPLNQYLQDDALTGQWGDRVTARHVLTHSTGLPNWRSQNDEKLTPTFEPGTRFQYSGEGFFHLQRVVEHITGSGFESIMQERIFKPLGMSSSTYIWLPDGNERVVAGHNGPRPFYNREIAIMVFDIIQASGKPLSFWTCEQIRPMPASQTAPFPPCRMWTSVPAIEHLRKPTGWQRRSLEELHARPSVVRHGPASRVHIHNEIYSSPSRSLAMTVKSSSVVVSPLTSPVVASSRRRRRMILPLRVLGSAWVKVRSSGRASAPISLATHWRSSCRRCFAGFVTAFEGDEDGDGLPLHLVRTADCCGFGDLGMGDERGLDLHGAEAVAADVDDVVDASHQPEVAVGVAAAPSPVK